MIKYPEILKVDEENFIELQELMEQDRLEIKGNFYFCIAYIDFVKLRNDFENQPNCTIPIDYHAGKYSLLGYSINIISSWYKNKSDVLEIHEGNGNCYKSFKLQYQTKEN